MGGKGAAALSVRVFSMPVVEWEYCHAFIVAGTGRGGAGAMVGWVGMRMLTSVGGCVGIYMFTLVREGKKGVGAVEGRKGGIYFRQIQKRRVQGRHTL